MNLKFFKWKQNKQLYAIECQKFETICDSDTPLSRVDDVNMGTDENEQSVLPKEGPMGWHTCGICLEDIFDDNLMVHNVCGGILCRDCLGVTASYYTGKSFPCPVLFFWSIKLGLSICCYYLLLNCIPTTEAIA